MTSSFTNTFGGSPVSPADVAYAAYSFASDLTLFWPQFSEGQTSVAARFMKMTATASSLDIIMPDATLNSIGYDAIIFNAGSNAFNVVDFNGGAIATIAAGQTYYLMMTNNATQAGTWLTIQFGVGTGSASAAALAGLGLIAVAGVLDVNFAVTTETTDFNVTLAGRGGLYNWTGGSGTATLPLAASVGNGFFFMLSNNGSGSLTVATTGGNTIDGAATSVFNQTQSGFVMSDGANWETVGKGIQNTFAVTLLNLNVAGSSDVTETSAQAQNIIQQFTGALTGNINVIVPATVQLYFCSNQTSGAFTLTVKTAAGTGVVVTQSTNAILYCDGVNIVNAFTAQVSGTLSLLAGSAPSPSLSFQTSVGLGLFSPGANLVSFAANSVEAFRLTAQASAVNFFGSIASATGVALSLGAVGTDTNIGINIVPKGTGTVTLGKLDGTVIGSGTAAAITGTTINGTTITAATQFIGPGTGLTGTAASLNIGGNAATATSATSATTATNATNVAVTDDTTTNATMFPLWVTASTGNRPPKVSSTKISFNPSTGTLSASAFSGPLTGNVTGNVSGNAGTVTTNANLTGPVTSVGNATSIASSINLPGSPTTTTQSAGDNSTKVATTAYIDRGASGASMVLISTATASASAEIAFTGIPAGYDEYRIVLTNVVPATDTAILKAIFGQGGGPSYITANYNWATLGYIAATSGAAGADAAAAFQVVPTNASNTAGAGISSVYTFFALGTAGSYHGYHGEGWMYNSGGPASEGFHASGFYNGDTTAITAIKFTFSAGNIATGKFALYGIRNS